MYASNKSFKSYFDLLLTDIKIYKQNLMKIFCISRSNGWTDLHGFGLKMNASKSAYVRQYNGHKPQEREYWINVVLWSMVQIWIEHRKSFLTFVTEFEWSKRL